MFYYCKYYKNDKNLNIYCLIDISRKGIYIRNTCNNFNNYEISISNSIINIPIPIIRFAIFRKKKRFI